MMDRPYSIVELVQGTKAWLEWRRGGIGASDAPAVMGESPWKSADRLLREKAGLVPIRGMNEVMRRGTELEPEARAKYIEESGMSVDPVCIQSRTRGWQRASLDGLSRDGLSAVEIKCGESVYRETERTRKVPKYYYGQLQHIMSVSGVPSMHFWCYLPRRAGILLDVERDGRYIENLDRVECAFWEMVLARTGRSGPER